MVCVKKSLFWTSYVDILSMTCCRTALRLLVYLCLSAASREYSPQSYSPTRKSKRRLLNGLDM